MPNPVKKTDPYQSLADILGSRKGNPASGNGRSAGRSVNNTREMPQDLLSGHSDPSCAPRRQMRFCKALCNRSTINREQVHQYLEQGASLNEPVTLGVFRKCYPLHFASFFGNQPVLEAMLATGKGDINVQSESGFTALDVACGAELPAARRNRQSSKALEPSTQERDNTVSTLLKAQARSGRNRTALHYAAEQGFISLIDVLINANFSVNNVENPEQEAPLHSAASRSQYFCAVRLAQHGADIDCKNHLEQTPLHRVCISGGNENEDSAKTAAFLLEAGADYTLCDKKTRRKPAQKPFEHAARLGKDRLIKAVVEQTGIFVTPNERTCLAEAAMANSGSQYKFQIPKDMADQVKTIVDDFPDTNSVISLQRLCKKAICQGVRNISSVQQLGLPQCLMAQVMAPALPDLVKKPEADSPQL